MKEETKARLIAYNESKGYGTTDADLIETVVEGKEVWEGQRDRHRWYTLIPTVISVADMFIQYDYCDVDGETANVNDCIGGYKLENMVEVMPKIVETTIYEPIS